MLASLCVAAGGAADARPADLRLVRYNDPRRAPDALLWALSRAEKCKPAGFMILISLGAVTYHNIKQELTTIYACWRRAAHTSQKGIAVTTNDVMNLHARDLGAARPNLPLSLRKKVTAMSANIDTSRSGLAFRRARRSRAKNSGIPR